MFCCGHDAALLEDLHECYAAFARRQRTIALNTSCECDACRRIPDLDLKFVAHHGSFVEHEVAGRRELVGPDVITVHRMLKNSVAERLELHGYALLSDACVAAEDIDASGLREHARRYAEIGEVRGVVVDLAERWRAAPAVRLRGQPDIVLGPTCRAASGVAALPRRRAAALASRRDEHRARRRARHGHDDALCARQEHDHAGDRRLAPAPTTRSPSTTRSATACGRSSWSRGRASRARG